MHIAQLAGHRADGRVGEICHQMPKSVRSSVWRTSTKNKMFAGGVADGGVQRGSFSSMRHAHQANAAVGIRRDDAVGGVGRSVGDHYNVQQIVRVVEA